MERHVAIICPDPVFSQCMSRRLLHLIPETQISMYSPVEISDNTSLVLTQEVILYDETQMNVEILQRHTGVSSRPLLIPLQTHGTENRRTLTGTALTKIVMAASEGCRVNSDIVVEEKVCQPFLFDTSPESVRDHRSRGHVRFMVSFADRSEREKYISQNMQQPTTNGQRVIRLDLMSGMDMINPFRESLKSQKNGKEVHSSGISELLLHLENASMEPAALLAYVQMGQDGFYHFGFPVRSDDIICSQPQTMVHLLHLLRRLADDPKENTVVLVVIASLPFQVLKQICSLAHELHVILPSQNQTDQKMSEWEISDLFSSLSPKLLKFISSSKKEPI